MRECETPRCAFRNKKLSTKYYNALDDNTKLLPLLKEAAAASDLVIITSVAYIKYLPEVMREYPACSFLTFDTNNLDGVTEIVFREEEGSFLAEALAAIMTTREDVERINDEKKIGIILGKKSPSRAVQAWIHCGRMVYKSRYRGALRIYE